MNHLHEGETKSLWSTPQTTDHHPLILENEETDVCVVGAGLAGLSIAYHLLKKGKKIILLEAEDFDHSESTKSTAHCTTALDTRYSDLIKKHDIDTIRLVANSQEEALNKLLEIIYVENISCDLEKLEGNLFYCREDNGNKHNQLDEKEKESFFLQEELEAINNAGLSDVYISRQQKILFNHFYNFKSPSICFPNQYQLNPVKLIHGLIKVILSLGGKIYTSSRVIKIHTKELQVVTVENGCQVTASQVVVATNNPITDELSIQSKIISNRTYVVALEVPLGLMKPFLFWDTEIPYHYARLERSPYRPYDLILIGGEDHRTGHLSDHSKEKIQFKNLEDWGRRIFQSVGKIHYQWSGQIIEPLDGIDYIGRSSLDEKNIFIATGFGGNGITYSMISGLLISDLICHKFNSWEKVYSPKRIHMSSAIDYLKNNINTLKQYSDWVSDSIKFQPDQLEMNEGNIFRDGINLCAAYKDENGLIEIFSAACPHLGGIIHWNAIEKSWDCPCHGSRFDCHGSVINGPSVFDLTPYISVDNYIPPASSRFEKQLNS